MRERFRSVLQGPVAVALLILAAGAALVGVAVARTSRAPSSPPAVSRPGAPVRAAAHPSSATPCGTTRRRPTWQHVVWVVMENRDYGGIVGTGAAPYVNRLGRKCGVATRFSAETHPSLPNYIAMTSGSTQGISDDADPSAHRLSVPSIFSQLGGGWRSLHESMPGNCESTPSGLYAVKHNPAAYYTNVASACAAQDVPLMSPPDLSARFTLVKPNSCHDTHDCSVATGDAWMAGFLPKILNSPQYRAGRTAVFITWDEGTNPNRIPTFVIAPSTRRGTLSATAFSHYSLLRTTEEMLGLPLLGNASKAASMRSAFHL